MIVRVGERRQRNGILQMLSSVVHADRFYIEKCDATVTVLGLETPKHNPRRNEFQLFLYVQSPVVK